MQKLAQFEVAAEPVPKSEAPELAPKSPLPFMVPAPNKFKQESAQICKANEMVSLHHRPAVLAVLEEAALDTLAAQT